MTTLTEAATACCACLRVHWKETKHETGEVSGRWHCTLCGNDFVPAGVLRFEQAKLAAFEQRYREAVQINVQLQEQLDGAKADLVNAARVLTEAQAELEQLRDGAAEAFDSGAAAYEELKTTHARAVVEAFDKACEEYGATQGMKDYAADVAHHAREFFPAWLTALVKTDSPNEEK